MAAVLAHMGLGPHWVREDRYASGITQPTERLAMDGETGHSTRDGLVHPNQCSPYCSSTHDGLGFSMRE